MKTHLLKKLNSVQAAITLDHIYRSRSGNLYDRS